MAPEKRAHVPGGARELDGLPVPRANALLERFPIADVPLLDAPHDREGGIRHVRAQASHHIDEQLDLFIGDNAGDGQYLVAHRTGIGRIRVGRVAVALYSVANNDVAGAGKTVTLGRKAVLVLRYEPVEPAEVIAAVERDFLLELLALFEFAKQHGAGADIDQTYLRMHATFDQKQLGRRIDVPQHHVGNARAANESEQLIHAVFVGPVQPEENRG